jgi:tetratricopeptide (TPR) repeat protein
MEGDQKMENSFVSAVLHFKRSNNESNWTKGVCKSIELHNFDQIPYYQSQLLEPSVLIEVANEVNISLDKIKNINYESDGPMKKIQWLYNEVKYATDVQKLNLACSLAAIARYELAKKIVEEIDINKLHFYEKLVYYLQKFYIMNRLNPNTPSDVEFSACKRLIDDFNLPNNFVLSVCSQAIVWKIKTNCIKDDLFEWFVKKGLDIVKNMESDQDFKNNIAVSSFYRAYSMIPYSKGNIADTRSNMQKAYDYAYKAIPKNELHEIIKVDALKTVHESELKEHLYLTKDYEKALKVGMDLIELDPNWTISYQESAEVYLAMNQYENALKMYQKALTLGFPRKTFSQYMIGYCNHGLNREDEAIDAYKKTLVLDPTNLSAGISGYNLTAKNGHPDKELFKSKLEEWEKLGYFKEEHKELLNYV